MPDVWGTVVGLSQTANPFISLFLIGVTGVLWRTHVKDQRTIVSITRSSIETMGELKLTFEVAFEKLRGDIRERDAAGRRGRR